LVTDAVQARQGGRRAEGPAEASADGRQARRPWVDYFGWLRAVAAVSIVFMHAIVSTLKDATPAVDDLVARAVGQAVMIPLTRWAVPVFFMITGALLLDPEKDVGPDRIRRYVWRMVVVLLTFGLAFNVSELMVQDGVGLPEALGQGLGLLVSGYSWDHMWYVYALIGVYLFVPALRAFVRAASRETYLLTLGAIYALCFVVPTLNSLLSLDLATLHVPEGVYPVGYVLLGYYAHKNLRLDWRIGLAGGACCAAATAIGAWAELAETSAEYAFFPQGALVAPFALAVFLAFRRLLDHVPVSEHPAARTLDRLGFGLYVIHPVFVHAFVALVPTTFAPLWLYVLCCFLVSLALGLAATWAVERVPWLGRYL
jgi:surface polysaccharide O-acyltransferase-like enzyme